MTSQDLRAVGWLTLAVLITSVPFLKRPYFVDDYYHVVMARGLLTHPARPYDFVADDEGPGNKGWERGQRPRMVNPPLFHYFLAAVMKVWGETVWKLRSSTLIFAWASAVCAYFIGKHFVARPLYGALLMILTPAFWLTEYSLLLDGAQLALFLAALWTFMIGQEKRRLRWILLSGLLMGLTLLTKYFGVLILPVALLWQWTDGNRRQWRGGYSAFGVALVVLAIWCVWTFAAYGQMHLLATLPRGFQGRTPPMLYLGKALVVASFIGGSYLFVLGNGFFLAKQLPRVLGWLLGLSAALFLLFASARGGFASGTALLMTLFVFGAVSFALCVGLLPVPGVGKNATFLKAWWWLGLVELLVVMPWTAGRYLLLLLPPSVWLFQLWQEEFDTIKWANVVLATTAFFSLGLAIADYAEANTLVKISHTLAAYPAPAGSSQRYYFGDTFSGYDSALGPLGWKAAFPTTDLKRGDWLLIPHYRTSAWWVLPHPERLRVIAHYDFPSRWPLRVMDVPASAGFYASCWGALPFVFSRHPLESFQLCEMQ